MVHGAGNGEVDTAHGMADGNAAQPPVTPGEILPARDPIILNAGKDAIQLPVTNTADRPIQVGSHYHFFEANRALRFDRGASYGMRLAIAAGAAVRFEPGETRPVRLIPLAGTREVWGCNGLVQGALDDPGVRSAAFARARDRGFADLAAEGGSDG